MIDASVRMYTGYIQVHGKDYWEKKSLDESMILDEEHLAKLKNTRGCNFNCSKI